MIFKRSFAAILLFFLEAHILSAALGPNQSLGRESSNLHNAISLHQACRTGNYGLVVAYLKKDILRVDSVVNGNTPLHEALLGKQYEICKFLLIDWGADGTIKNNEGKTSLDLAFDLHYRDIVKILQDQRKRKQMREAQTGNIQGHPGMQSQSRSSLIRAEESVRNGSLSSMSSLGTASLVAASSTSANQSTVRSSLVQQQKSVLGSVKNPSTELARFLRACLTGKTEEVAAFLQKGIKTEQWLPGQFAAEYKGVKREALSALHLACLTGNSETCKLLLRAGADANVRDEDDRNLLFYIIDQRKDTPISVNLCRLLLEHGCNVNAQEYESQTSPLHLAALFSKNTDLCELLINFNGDLTQKDHWDQTPLHLAAKQKNRALCQFLLERGADISAVDQFGLLPSDLARGNDQKAIETRDYLVAVRISLDEQNQENVSYDPVIIIKCRLCQEHEATFITPCCHKDTFCKECWESWTEEHQECPRCRVFENPKECTICLANSASFTTPCCHEKTICQQCWDEWANQHHTCPYCRAEN